MNRLHSESKAHRDDDRRTLGKIERELDRLCIPS